jgi:hypothetical protein
MPDVRSVKVRATDTSPALIVVTLADGPSRPLGGPRWTHVYDEGSTATDNHADAVEAFGFNRLGMDRPHAGGGAHLGYGSFRWTLTDRSAPKPTNPELWKD